MCSPPGAGWKGRALPGTFVLVLVLVPLLVLVIVLVPFLVLVLVLFLVLVLVLGVVLVFVFVLVLVLVLGLVHEQFCFAAFFCSCELAELIKLHNGIGLVARVVGSKIHLRVRPRYFDTGTSSSGSTFLYMFRPFLYSLNFGLATVSKQPEVL